MARLDYNDAVFSPIPAYLNKRLQRVQLVTVGFVLNRYARETDILSLGWLPITERRDFHLLKLSHKALYSSNWPAYLPLEQYVPTRTLRLSASTHLLIPVTTGTFQYTCSKDFNRLPENIRTCTDSKRFAALAKAFLTNVATY